jgi:hypothetical protein
VQELACQAWVQETRSPTISVSGKEWVTYFDHKRKSKGGYFSEIAENKIMYTLGLGKILCSKSEISPYAKKEIPSPPAEQYLGPR